MEKKIKLKPIVYSSNAFKSGHQNTAQQMFLLKALKITQDPKKLREMIGVKSVAQVYQTLDKLAMRKEEPRMAYRPLNLSDFRCAAELLEHLLLLKDHKATLPWLREIQK